jgi:hypothetical protein
MNLVRLPPAIIETIGKINERAMQHIESTDAESY